MSEGQAGPPIHHESETKRGISATEATLRRLFERQEERNPMPSFFAFNDVLRSQIEDSKNSDKKNNQESITYVKGLQEAVILMIQGDYLSVKKQTALVDYCSEQTEYWMEQANVLPTTDPEQKDQATFNTHLFDNLAQQVRLYHTPPLADLPPVQTNLALAA